MRTIASCVVEHELGQRAGQLGLADAGRAEEEERADRPVGVAEAGARAAQRVGDGLDRLVLADDAPVQALLHVDELLDLALQQPADRDAGPLGDDLGDVLGRDLLLEEAGVAVRCAPRPRRARARARGSRRSAARPRAARSASRSARSASCVRLRRALARPRRRARCASFSACHCAFISADALAQLGELALDRLAARRPRRRRSPSPATLRSISSCMMPALDLVDLGRAPSRSRCAGARRPRR